MSVLYQIIPSKPHHALALGTVQARCNVENAQSMYYVTNSESIIRLRILSKAHIAETGVAQCLTTQGEVFLRTCARDMCHTEGGIFRSIQSYVTPPWLYEKRKEGKDHAEHARSAMGTFSDDI